MATDNGPSRDVSPSKESFPKKSVGKDWGGEDDAMNMPNTPSMKQWKENPSPNLYADYCGDNEQEPLFDGDKY